jgi:hypothetical protein
MKLYIATGILLTFLASCGKDGEDPSPRTTPKTGPQGPSGTSCYVTPNDDGALIECGDGSKAQVNHGEQGSVGPKGDTGQMGPTGKAGDKGEPGRDGLSGKDGTDGINGSDGIDGSPGSPGSLIVPIIPCPSRVGQYPEVLMCIDDKLYAVFVGSGLNSVRYSEIPPGRYQTTDGRACNFSVTSGCTLGY